MPNASEFLILLLALAFVGPLVLTFLINKHPELIAKGQDAAGRGMAVGCSSIMLIGVSAAIAIAGVIVTVVVWEKLAWFWRILGPLPAFGLGATFFYLYTASQLKKARRIERDYQEAMSIPAALIVDNDDARFSALYDAIKPSFPTLEISTRHPGALYWQQREWFPRVRLLMMNAEAMTQTQGQTGELARDLLDDMCRAKPVCPIVLHAATPDAAALVRDRLTKSGWNIQTVLTDTPDWITSRWTSLATTMLNEELTRRPEPTPQSLEA